MKCFPEQIIRYSSLKKCKTKKQLSTKFEFILFELNLKLNRERKKPDPISFDLLNYIGIDIGRMIK